MTGMKQPQRCFECGEKILPRNRGSLAIRSVNSGLIHSISQSQKSFQKIGRCLHRFMKSAAFEREFTVSSRGG